MIGFNYQGTTMKKQLRLDLNRFPQNSPERKTFEQIQQYLLALDESNGTRFDLKTEVFEGIAPANGSTEPQPILIVQGKVYSARGFTETPLHGSFTFKRWIPIGVHQGGAVQYGIHYEFSKSDNEVSLNNPTTENLKYRVVVQYK
jgi:hypothetical protein